jgi:hypothetical protein
LDRRYGLPYVAEYWSNVAGSPPFLAAGPMMADGSDDGFSECVDADDVIIVSDGIGLRSYNRSAVI